MIILYNIYFIAYNKYFLYKYKIFLRYYNNNFKNYLKKNINI